jgi:hypothetical protein
MKMVPPHQVTSHHLQILENIRGSENETYM